MSRQIIVVERSECVHGRMASKCGAPIGSSTGSAPLPACPGGGEQVLSGPTPDMIERAAKALQLEWESDAEDTIYEWGDLTASEQQYWRDWAEAALVAALWGDES